MIVYSDDAATVGQPFMIVKVDEQYVVCDKALPMIENSDMGSIGFSYQASYEALPYVEKALAVYF